MWFGDLVTMQLVGRPVAQRVVRRVGLLLVRGRGHRVHRRLDRLHQRPQATGYRADQLPCTHPIAADNVDLHAVEVNFDVITYAKGASVLKQLVAWVGLDNFLEGLRAYFKDHAFGNTEFADLLVALEKSSGRELEGWAQEWLQTAGVNTLAPRLRARTPTATTRSFAVAQTAAADYPTLRRHRLGIGLYDEVDGRLVRRDVPRGRRRGRLTEVAELVGTAAARPAAAQRRGPRLRQDPPRRALARDRDRRARRQLDDSLARALCLGRRVGHDPRRRDVAPPTSSASCSPTSAPRPTPGASPGSRRTPRSRSTRYSAPGAPGGAAREWEQGLRELLLDAEPGSDHQLTFARAYAGAPPHSDQALGRPHGAARRHPGRVEGLAVDQDLRWVAAHRAGRGGSLRRGAGSLPS